MKLYVPALGEQIRLTADWTFDLYNETRNETLMEHMGDTRSIAQWCDKETVIPCTLPAGSILQTDRIFIRKGLEKYNSITFFLVGKKTQSKVIEFESVSFCMGNKAVHKYTTKKPARTVRFWVRLDDANNIEFEKV